MKVRSYQLKLGRTIIKAKHWKLIFDHGTDHEKSFRFFPTVLPTLYAQGFLSVDGFYYRVERVYDWDTYKWTNRWEVTKKARAK